MQFEPFLNNCNTKKLIKVITFAFIDTTWFDLFNKYNISAVQPHLCLLNVMAIHYMEIMESVYNLLMSQSHCTAVYSIQGSTGLNYLIIISTVQPHLFLLWVTSKEVYTFKRQPYFIIVRRNETIGLP